MLCAGAADATTLQDYRYFRALTIDLLGRLPTRDEVSAFGRGEIDTDRFIDEHLKGPAYAERIRRIYMDLLRLEINKSFEFVPKTGLLRRYRILGPDGKPLDVYFRLMQRRRREATDGDFCLTQDETGLQFPKYLPASGTPKPVSAAALEANTVLVRPWWLYRDYRSSGPVQRYDASWAKTNPGFQPVDSLLTDADGSPTTAIRVCKEEAQTAETGTVYATGRKFYGSPPYPYGRLSPLPIDIPWATAHAGEPIQCWSGTSVTVAPECGCGVGLERCLPAAGPNLESQAFVVPDAVPLGETDPSSSTPRFTAQWVRYWWSREVVHFLEDLVGNDGDFREVLTGRQTFVNGPLAQFDRWTAATTCCGDAAGRLFDSGPQFGFVQPEPLVDPSKVPTDLPVNDTATWRRIDDRGPHAAGILTMPIFLAKYGSRRGRAHALYNAFLCKDFVAARVKLPPSTEPNLTIRPGCSSCHVKLEPIAAFFARITESDWNYLPAKNFPLISTQCAAAEKSLIPKECVNYYDPAFTTATEAKLRGSYGSPENAEAGPHALAEQIVATPDFASCVAENIASSFIGRRIGDEDVALRDALAKTFADANFRISALVRALVKSEAYRDANNLNPTVLRAEAKP